MFNFPFPPQGGMPFGHDGGFGERSESNESNNERFKRNIREK